MRRWPGPRQGPGSRPLAPGGSVQPGRLGEGGKHLPSQQSQVVLREGAVSLQRRGGAFCPPQLATVRRLLFLRVTERASWWGGRGEWGEVQGAQRRKKGAGGKTSGVWIYPAVLKLLWGFINTESWLLLKWWQCGRSYWLAQNKLAQTFKDESEAGVHTLWPIELFNHVSQTWKNVMSNKSLLKPNCFHKVRKHF